MMLGGFGFATSRLVESAEDALPVGSSTRPASSRTSSVNRQRDDHRSPLDGVAEWRVREGLV
jgi:hypothetical protein